MQIYNHVIDPRAILLIVKTVIKMEPDSRQHSEYCLLTLQITNDTFGTLRRILPQVFCGKLNPRVADRQGCQHTQAGQISRRK